MPELPSVRRLPVVMGSDHLAFHCNRCGACCKSLRVAVTHFDVLRLVQALGYRAAELVDWLPPSAVDMTDEPGTFFELPEGRRLMVLRQERGACRLLDDEQRCGAYAARPLDCALFPFDLERDEAGFPVRLSLLRLDGCSDERGTPASLDEVAALDARRWHELAQFQAHVARWNRLVRHRRRFRRAAGGAAELLQFLGLENQ